MLGTAFSVYDGGLNPEKASEGSVRHELAAVECVVPPQHLEIITVLVYSFLRVSQV